MNMRNVSTCLIVGALAMPMGVQAQAGDDGAGSNDGKMNTTNPNIGGAESTRPDQPAVRGNNGMVPRDPAMRRNNERSATDDRNVRNPSRGSSTAGGREMTTEVLPREKTPGLDGE